MLGRKTVYQITTLNVSEDFDIVKHVQSLGMPTNADSSIRRSHKNDKVHIVAAFSIDECIESLFYSLRDDPYLTSVGSSRLPEDMANYELHDWPIRGSKDLDTRIVSA